MRLSYPLSALLLIAACGARAPEAGDPCRAETSAPVCASGDALLACRTFTWHRDSCRGPTGCAAAQCDQTVAARGDSCGVAGRTACSLDGKELLRCDGSTMTTEHVCRGEHGCTRVTPQSAPTCDPGAPEVGDACLPPSAGGSRCGPHATTMLKCSTTTHRYELERDCLGPRGCFESTAYPGFLTCDVSAGEAGEACEGYVGVGAGVGSGGSFCSKDGTKLLTCKDGGLITSATCACSVTWEGDSGYTITCEDPPDAGRHHVSHGSAPFLALAEHR